jgi:hypothetical protein
MFLDTAVRQTSNLTINKGELKVVFPVLVAHTMLKFFWAMKLNH